MNTQTPAPKFTIVNRPETVELLNSLVGIERLSYEGLEGDALKEAKKANWENTVGKIAAEVPEIAPALKMVTAVHVFRKDIDGEKPFHGLSITMAKREKAYPGLLVKIAVALGCTFKVDEERNQWLLFKRDIVEESVAEMPTKKAA